MYIVVRKPRRTPPLNRVKSILKFVLITVWWHTQTRLNLNSTFFTRTWTPSSWITNPPPLQLNQWLVKISCVLRGSGLSMVAGHFFTSLIKVSRRWSIIDPGSEWVKLFPKENCTTRKRAQSLWFRAETLGAYLRAGVYSNAVLLLESVQALDWAFAQCLIFLQNTWCCTAVHYSWGSFLIRQKIFLSVLRRFGMQRWYY